MERKLPLHTKMLIGFLAGAIGGLVAHRFFAGEPALAWTITWIAQPVGRLFLRLLFMLIIPLVFSALVLGVVGLGDLRSLGRVGFRTFVYTVPGYAIALGVSLYVLWTFGRIDGDALATVAGSIVVLGFPAALGAAIARLVV